jgi:hypothetical protein
MCNMVSIRCLILRYVLGESPARLYLISSEEELSLSPAAPYLNPCDCFLWGYLKSRVFQKRPHIFQELKIVIQSEMECTYTATLIQVVRSSVFQVLKVREVIKYNTEQVLV